MNLAKSGLLSVVALLLLLAIPLQAQRATVKVRRAASGSIDVHEGVIVSEDSYRVVKAKKGARKYTWPADRVIDVRYQRKPSAFKKGLQAFEDGALEEAATRMREALKSASKYSWLEAYANWYAGEALNRLGVFKDAQGHYEAILSKARKSRFVPQALIRLAEISLIKGDAAGARRHFKKLGDLAKRERLPERYGSHAELGMATVEARFGDAEKGLEELKKIQSAASDATIKNKCALEIGQTYIRQKKFSQARSYFKTIEKNLDKENPDPMLIAGAANGLGDCLWQLKKYDEAVLAYSRVYALFLERPELRSHVAHALYWGGCAFDALAGLEKDTDARRKLRSRARRLWRKAFREFKGTRGGELARKKLGG